MFSAAPLDSPGAVTEQALPVRLDLLERDTELATVESRAVGSGRLLAIEGPPGIGKTALIAEAKGRAQAAGAQVLSARGSELERSFSYGVVRQLFESFLASLPAGEQAELLSGPAELAAPLFDPAQIGALLSEAALREASHVEERYGGDEKHEAQRVQPRPASLGEPTSQRDSLHGHESSCRLDFVHDVRGVTQLSGQ